MASTQWPPWDVTSVRHRLDELAKLVKGAPKAPEWDEAVGWLARLLVVSSSGYVEQVAVEVARAYIWNRSGGLVSVFARSWLVRSRNPTPENLEDLVGRFDANLRTELEVFLDQNDQRLRRELAFMVDRRNRIAHGLNEGIAATRALALRDVAIEVGDWFILRFRPH